MGVRGAVPASEHTFFHTTSKRIKLTAKTWRHLDQLR